MSLLVLPRPVRRCDALLILIAESFFVTSALLSSGAVAQDAGAEITADETAEASATADAAAEESAPAEGAAALAQMLDAAVGETVTIELESGVHYEDAKLVRIDRNKKTGEIRRLRLRLADGKSRVVGISAVQRVVVGDQATMAERQEEEAAGEDKPNRRRTRADRRAEQEAQRKRMAELERSRWLAQLAARGVEAWSPLSLREHQEAVARHKQRYQQVAAQLPDLKLVETKHFLFCTNIPSEEVSKYVQSLDRMYAWMQKAYGVDPGLPVWRGKASIYAFATREQFLAFERQYMKNRPPEGTAGLCHYDSDRNVCMAVYRGDDLDYFGLVLVHETSHGFIHCYRTPVQAPSWVNEGMAEVIASLMVPESKGVEHKEQQFIKSLKDSAQPRLGANFFDPKSKLEFKSYGGASSMTRFLVETDQEKYVQFIDLLKSGMPWEEALGLSFRATPAQLVKSYGRWIGVPNLAP